ncbi:MAG: UbiA family prenyltransferase [Candidatus Hatepunaea meridiana]|nr:UbiA family prenyltransferase [Candidatus Hatepunaea meridiana]
MVLIGHHIALVSNSGLDSGFIPCLGWERWVLLIFALCSCFGLVYVLNQIRDRKSDSDNGKLFLIAGKTLSCKHLIIEAVILALLFPIALLLAGFGNLIIWILLMFLFAGILYNFTPFELQNNPVGGLIAGVIGAWLLIKSGSMIVGISINWQMYSPYLIAFSSACILTSLLDKKGDEANGKRTFTVVFGERKTILIGLVGLIITAAWGIYNKDWIIAVPAIISTPILFWAWHHNDITKAVIANKTAIFSLSVAIGLFYPVYLIVIVLYYYFARWYYAHRLGLRYPSFWS